MLMTMDGEVQERGGRRGEAAETAEEETAPNPSNGQEQYCEIKELVDLIESTASIGDYRMMQKKESHILVRRLKILLLLLEDVNELHGQVPETSSIPFSNLKKALLCAKELLITCSVGSKIYLVRCLTTNFLKSLSL